MTPLGVHLFTFFGKGLNFYGEDKFKMVYEEIFESIEVISLFKEGKLQPLRFKWNGRTYKINRVNGHWVSHLGQGKQYHFSLIADSTDYFEITFDTSSFDWQIARVCMEG